MGKRRISRVPLTSYAAHRTLTVRRALDFWRTASRVGAVPITIRKTFPVRRAFDFWKKKAFSDTSSHERVSARNFAIPDSIISQLIQKLTEQKAARDAVSKECEALKKKNKRLMDFNKKTTLLAQLSYVHLPLEESR